MARHGLAWCFLTETWCAQGTTKRLSTNAVVTQEGPRAPTGRPHYGEAAMVNPALMGPREIEVVHENAEWHVFVIRVRGVCFVCVYVPPRALLRQHGTNMRDRGPHRGYLLLQWLQQFDARLTRPALLLLDNVSSHKVDAKFKHPPPNCPAICQPLDQRIIRSFKSRYRSKILTCKFQRVALQNIGMAWKDISAKLGNCMGTTPRRSHGKESDDFPSQ